MICGLAKDMDGNIWCSTFNGINCITSESRNIISFNTGNATYGKEYVQRAYYSDGERIYFGDGEGVTHFVPPISTDKVVRDVVLTNIYVGPDRVNRSALDRNSNISLSYNQSTFTLEFSSMAIRDAENVRFSYRLLGLDDSWHMTRYGINQITYNSLRPGTYTLEVCTTENGFTSPARQWKIRIEQPWYRSTGANIFYILALGGIIILIIFTAKKRKSKVTNEQRLKYYVNIAHEVRSPMVMIINPIEKLLKKSTDPEITHGLKTMKRNSERVIRMLDSFLDIRKIDNGQMTLQIKETDMIKLVTDSLGAFAYEADKRGILIDFKHPSEIITCMVDPYNMDSVIST
jgi:signal transduction histidine kinase